MKMTIGVMGSASGAFGEETLLKLIRLGRAIAHQDAVLITGACPGLPYAAVRGAKAAGGMVIGISPGLSRVEHVHKYQSPVEDFDALIYTGSGLMGREVETIRSADIIVVAGGHSGTLAEFAIGYDEGRLIGALTGTGGIAEAIEQLVRTCDKATGAVVLYDDDPERLIERLVGYYQTEHHKRPNCFSCPPESQPAPAGEGLGGAATW